MRARRLAALAVLLAACGGSEEPPAEPRSALEVGAGAVVDPEGAADYLVDLGAGFTGEVRRAAFLVRNRGDADLPLAVEGLAPPFSLEGTPPVALPAGGRVELILVFAPVEAGAASGLVTVGAGEERVRLRLAAVGHAPAVRCAPGALEFGTVLRGEALTLAFACENGAALADELHLGGFVGDGAAAFRWELPESGVVRRLEPGGRFEVAVTFAPFANPEVAARIPLGRKVLDDLDSVLLLGSGAAVALATEPEEIDLGAVPAGAATAFAFSIRNRSIREHRVTLEAPAAVSIDGAVSLVLPPRSLTEVAAALTPDGPGPLFERIRIVPDDPDLDPAYLPVRGEAVDP